jgi:hypothetical protein
MNLRYLLPTSLPLLFFVDLTAEPLEDATTEAIRQAALDYVDGTLSGEPERVAKGVHPSLHKITVAPGPGGVDVPQVMDRQTLIEYARLGGERPSETEHEVDFTPLAVYGNIATVKIDTADFLDYAHAAHVNGEWRIVNVLWCRHGAGEVAEPTAEDLAAIEQVGLDYVDGFYAGSAERIGRALHPRLQKVAVRELPNGREILQYSTPEGLVAYTRTGMGKKPAEKRKVEVSVLEVFANIATIAIDSADFLDYAHAAKINGDWKIVNVLWAPHERK